MGVVTKTFVECELDDNWEDKGFKSVKYNAGKNASGKQLVGFGVVNRKVFEAMTEGASFTLRYMHQWELQQGEIEGKEENVSLHKGRTILLGETSASYRIEETM